ncbi:hypothetical protein HA402_008097 [Bradysia odoriphaga]|nr:hypothetical protein HA402_008097 [Bradysia odoriphaga]
MIQLIIHLFTTISNGFYYLFWTSYSIGKLISWIFGSILNVLSFLWCNALEAGTVFSEDFIIFLKDFVEVGANVLDAGKDSIVTSCTFVYSLISATFATIAELFTTGNVHTANVGQQCLHSFAAMMNAMKNLFVLVGNGMWFILTLVPTIVITILTHMYQMAHIGLQIILDVAKDVWVNTKEITAASVNYFLDVPLQAIIGCIFIGLLVVYRRFTIRLTGRLIIGLSMYLKSRLLTALGAILSTLRRRNNNRSRLNYQPTYRRSSGGRSSTTSTSPNTKENVTDENVCVICRDEQRRVVLMPCRHMCLCMSCSVACSTTLRTCPLCRKPIKNTLSVYT